MKLENYMHCEWLPFLFLTCHGRLDERQHLVYSALWLMSMIPSHGYHPEENTDKTHGRNMEIIVTILLSPSQYISLHFYTSIQYCMAIMKKNMIMTCNVMGFSLIRYNFMMGPQVAVRPWFCVCCHSAPPLGSGDQMLSRCSLSLPASCTGSLPHNLHRQSQMPSWKPWPCEQSCNRKGSLRSVTGPEG